jgi:hypothetical protein
MMCRAHGNMRIKRSIQFSGFITQKNIFYFKYTEEIGVAVML